jgi:hypothetical protein
VGKPPHDGRPANDGLPLTGWHPDDSVGIHTRRHEDVPQTID